MTLKEIDEAMKELDKYGEYTEWCRQIAEDDYENGHIPTEETVGEGVSFERIRRITGYLVGDTSRFNDAKKAEEQDRVKHTFEGGR